MKCLTSPDRQDRLETVERRWEGETVAVVATGASLTRLDCARLEGLRVIAVKDAWRYCPFADLLYGCDHRWWKHWQGVPDFAGEKWAGDKHSTQSPDGFYCDANARLGVHTVCLHLDDDLSTDPRFINRVGGTSAGQAINIAFLAGAARILTLGLDNAGPHFFGDHPWKPNPKNAEFSGYRAAFALVAAQLARAGVDIVNCSPGTALKCFRRAPLMEVVHSA